MLEIGTIKELLPGQKALISFSTTDACQKCGACGKLSPASQDERLLTAENSLRAIEGDRVEVEISSSHFLGMTFMVFIMPLLAFFLGYALLAWVGTRIIPNLSIFKWVSIASGVLWMFIAFVAAKLVDAKLGSLRPKITRIIHG